MTMGQNASTAAEGRNFDQTLVALYDTQRLYSLARGRTPETKAQLTDAVAGFLDTELKTHEQEIVADIMLSLLQQAETDLRQALSERLAHNGRVPLRVALSLANDEIGVARAMLENSPVLNELDLLYIVQSQSADYWAAVAKRADLSHALIDTLAQKRDVTTASILLDNKSIDLAEGALRVFAEMAREAESLQRPLIHRSELPAELAREIYWAVGVELRNSLVAKYPDASFAEAVDTAMESVQQDLVNATEPAPHQVRIIKAPTYAHANTNATPAKMIESLRLGQLSHFMLLFAEYTGLQSCMVETLMRQRGGKGLAIVCKALRMERSDFMTVYMLKSSLSNKSRLVDQTELGLAVATFDRIQREFAQKMLNKARDAQSSFVPA